MESEAIDAVDFRDAQHKHWDAAAVGWKEWSEFNDSADGHISERLVELAGVRSGSRVLDVGAGYGEPALTAARRAGPGGRVVATDISAAMLAFGSERAAAAGLRNIEFIEKDASGLDFPPASFDAAVSRWGIIFEPDAEAAAGRIRGFLEPGARIAISSWGEPDQVPFLSIPMRTTMERLDVPPLPAGTPGPLSRPTPAAIAGLLEGAGISDVAGRPRREALSGPGSLSPSERRIADLPAEGSTTRDIAQALYVTPRTVEGHLTSIYRKLGIATRAGLPDALADPSSA